MFSPREFWRSVRANPGVSVFVWGAWLLMSANALSFIRTYGFDLPYYDEWEFVPLLTGHQPITLEWLWSQHNEHRIFLGRLVYLAVAKIGGLDFRSGMIFIALVLIACAAGLIERARKLRGSLEFTDAFFPLVLLTLGQAQNLLWSFQISFVLGPTIAFVVLMLATTREQLGFRAAVAIGVCALALPLLGGHGLALAPAFVLCTLLSAWELWNAEPGHRKQSLVLIGLALAAVSLIALYFMGYERPQKHPLSQDLALTADGALQFLTTGLGSGTRALWNQNSAWSTAGRYALYLAMAASGAALVVVFIRRPAERLRVLRVALVLGAICSLAVGTSWARSAFTILSESRYATLAAPLWCACYFAWELIDSATLRRVAQSGLLLIALALLANNHNSGRREAGMWRVSRIAVISQIDAGVSARKIVEYHHETMYYGGADTLLARMKMLREKGIGSCATLQD